METQTEEKKAKNNGQEDLSWLKGLKPSAREMIEGTIEALKTGDEETRAKAAAAVSALATYNHGVVGATFDRIVRETPVLDVVEVGLRIGTYTDFIARRGPQLFGAIKALLSR